MAEAHPSDGWALAPPAGQPWLRVKTHRSLEERVQAAQTLLAHFPMPPQCQLAVDSMDDCANVAYGVAFERVCVIQGRRVTYLGGKGPFFYNLRDVRRWLEKRYGKR